MPITTLSNVTAFNAQRHLTDTQRAHEKALAQLASGRRITKAGDDAAGLAISNNLRARIGSVGQAVRNSEDAFSLLQVAGQGMSEISDILIRMRELATQSATDTVGDSERELIEIENVELQAEIERIAQSTKYLSSHLLNGEGDDFRFHIGADNTEYDVINYNGDGVDVTAGALGVDGLDLSDRDSAADSLETIDTALKQLHVPMAQLGALQTRMETTRDNLEVHQESLEAANSRILDADYAKISTDLARESIKLQAGAAMVAQANQLPSLALKLL